MIHKIGLFFVKMVFTFTAISYFFYSNSGYASFSLNATPRTNPPQVGANVLELKISDDKGNSIEKAEVKVSVVMAAMGSMPKMQAIGQIKEQGKGLYLVNYELSMGGSWDVEITIFKGSEKQFFRYGVTTDVNGLQDKNSSNKSAKSTKKTGSISTESTENENILPLGVERIQKIGVRFVSVQNLPLTRTLRTFGVVESDSTKKTEVALRFSGYVEKQFKGRLGDTVRAGEALFTVYSPELMSAQSEYLLSKSNTTSSESLNTSNIQRLRNLGLSEKEIFEIEKSDKPKRNITIYSPQKGTLLEINVREGSGIVANQPLYVIGDLSKSFIVARVFQQDISNIHIGQPLEIRLTGEEALKYKGTVSLIYPSVNEGAGTANVRVVPTQFVRELRPGQYVDLYFLIDFGMRLVVPQTAILWSGTHKYVFKQRQNGELEPLEVTTGKSNSDMIEITSGLSAGEVVAASGTFLLSSEAQLRSALPKWKIVPATENSKRDDQGVVQ